MFIIFHHSTLRALRGHRQAEQLQLCGVEKRMCTPTCTDIPGSATSIGRLRHQRRLSSPTLKLATWRSSTWSTLNKTFTARLCSAGSSPQQRRRCSRTSWVRICQNSTPLSVSTMLCMEDIDWPKNHTHGCRQRGGSYVDPWTQRRPSSRMGGICLAAGGAMFRTFTNFLLYYVGILLLDLHR
jgi:hypothetical protein